MDINNNTKVKLLNRDTLTGMFKDGARPSGKIFANLIHSMVNKLDDGIEKNFEHGLSLSPQGNNAENLMSLFHRIDDKHAAWSLGLSTKEEGSGLNFKEGATNKSRLFIKKGGFIGINTTNPVNTLDVKGTIGIKSRKGTYATGLVKGNGKWQTILENQSNCKLFEITACAKGKPGEGKYALLFSLLINPYAGKYGAIKTYQSYFGWKWWRRLKLRWRGTPFQYSLEIRTASNYGIDADIEYHITQLY